MVHRTISKLVVFPIGAVIAAASIALSAQEPSEAPRFRGGVDLIQLAVSVLDDQRRPIRGLTAADFTVLDGGVVTPIRAFTDVEIPAAQPAVAATAAWVRDVAPDVATNQVGEAPGRLVVILIDRSIHFGVATVVARNIATSIVNALGPNDLAALVATGGNEPQVFTSDRARLTRAIAQADWSTDSDAFPWGLELSLSDGRCLCGLCVIEAVTRVAEALQNAPNRSKSVFFIGSGIILQVGARPPSSDPGCDFLVRQARQKMVDAIALSSATIHSIDPKSLVSIGPQTRASTPGGAPAPEGVAALRRREQQQAEMNELLATQGTLGVLPGLTGGRTVINRNAPEETIPEIFRESELYYLVGFEASVDSRAAARRSIEVKVNRRGARISTQRQYLVPGAPAPEPLSSTAMPNSVLQSIKTPALEALNNLLPDPHPPLRLTRATFARDDGPNALVSISVDVSNIVRSGQSPERLDASIVVVDQTGRSIGRAQEQFSVTGGAARSQAAPVDVATHIDLPAGSYELRVSIENGAGTTASVFAQVDVPDFSKERLSLSDIVIEGPAADTSTVAPFVRVSPTSVRSFGRKTPGKVFLQVYQGVQRTEPLLPVSIQARIVDVRDRVMHESGRLLAPEEFLGRRADYRAEIPTSDLPPGEYLYSVVATSGKESVRRSMRFAVE